jgi:uncharacterized membrane protein YhaH (DUF805 family)
MDFVNAIVSGYKGFVNFGGRTSRAPFWYWVLFQIIVGVIIAFVEGGGHTVVEGASIQSNYQAGPIAIVWNLINLLPGLAIGIRRLHDLDKSGWWTLIALTGIGAIVLLVWDGSKGTAGANRFGPDPLA